MLARAWLGSWHSALPSTCTKNSPWEAPGTALAPALTHQVGINIYRESGNLTECLPYPLALLPSFNSGYLQYSAERARRLKKMRWRSPGAWNLEEHFS